MLELPLLHQQFFQLLPQLSIPSHQLIEAFTTLK